jgi:hypothetical protein
VKTEKRSPLKDVPLHNPGQSVDDQLVELRERLFEPLIMALLFIIIAGLEWWRAYFVLPLNPWLFTVAAFLALGYAVYRVWRVIPVARALRLARDGERAVGQYLEQLRRDGYQVFHDVIGSGFNVDHVAIGPAGVFAIETKTFSKPASGPAKVLVDGDRILVDGRQPDRDPLVQGKAQANWLGNLLAESTGRKFRVRSVIVFPGWYVEQDRASRREVWVLNPKGLPSFLENEPRTLSPEDVKLASYHLSRFIRSSGNSV